MAASPHQRATSAMHRALVRHWLLSIALLRTNLEAVAAKGTPASRDITR